MQNPLRIAALILCLTAAAHAAPLIQPQPFVPMNMHERGKSFSTARATRVELIGDRYAYYNDERRGQFLAMFFTHVEDGDNPGLRIQLTLKREGDAGPIEQITVSPVTSPKLPILVETQSLDPGRYELTAALSNADGENIATVRCPIRREDKTDPRVDFPADGIPIHVHAQSHVPDATWPISTGVPMPKMTLRNVDELTLLENGKPVPAQFSTRATWSPQGYVKWVGVDFQARYNGGEPRKYHLVHDTQNVKHDNALTIDRADDKITVDTGAIRFVVGSKRFAGIEKAWINDQLVVNGEGGSYIVDQQGTRYTAAHDADVDVTVEDEGPLRATIAAKGWYTRPDGEKLCLFIVRITAHAGSPRLAISHRTVLTQTPLYGQDIYLTDVGFDVIPSESTSQWRFGADGGAIDAGGAEAFLHQDRSDHFRLVVDGETRKQGHRTDGWFAAATASGAEIGCYLRDAWQRFPHEFELTGDRMTIHFWPRHGHDVWTQEQELARDEIYKVRFAHEGNRLNFWTPTDYIDKLREYNEQENWAGGAELAMVRPDKTKIEIYDGMGVALGAEMYLSFTAAPKSGGDHGATMNLCQQNPHALADPKWNCDTQVFGPIAARDPEKFPTAEHLLDTAYNFYRHAIIDGGDDYGKWIYGAVHNNWDAGDDHANLKRVWQMCHYQNVFQAWLLYFRSGMRDHLDWARIHSAQHIDVGVSNYHVYPEGKHSYWHIGNIPGSMYHCKGFVPWGGNASTAGHWIDLTNYLMRFYLEGDRRGMDMVDDWLLTASKMGTSNRHGVPTTPDGFKTREVGQKVNEWRKENPDVKPADWPQWVKDENDRPRLFNPREVFVPLGEVTHLYQATWDPQALISMLQYAEYLGLPFEQTSSPSLSAFGKHWQDWYYDLTRDPRVIERINEFLNSDYHTRAIPNIPTFAAFLLHNTGETKWLAPLVHDIYGDTLNIYNNPGERYHHWSIAQSNPAAMLFGKLPMVLHAIDQAGLKFEYPIGSPTYVPSRGGRVDQADKWLKPPRGWSNTGVTILGWTPQPCRVAVAADGPMSYGSYRAFYMLFNDWPRLGQYTDASIAKTWYEQSSQQIVTFSSDNRFKDPPTHRNIGVGRGDDRQPFPYIEVADNDPDNRFYRLEYAGSPPQLPALLNADTKEPLPQVAVIPRTVFWGNEASDAPFRTVGVVNCFMRPLSDQAVIKLTVESVENRYWMPTTLRITDAAGEVIVDTSVFMAGQRPSDTVTLDAGAHPLPWRFESASSGDCRFSFSGVEELFFARTPEDFEAILPKLATSP